MNRAHRAVGLLPAALTAALIATAAGAGPAAGAATPAATGTAHQSRTARESVQRIALGAGLQVAPKHTSRPTVTLHGRRYPAPDPLLAELPQGSRVDLSYWRHRRAAAAVVGAAKAGAPRLRATIPVPRPRPYAERERARVLGHNDAVATAERIPDVGVGRRFQAASVTGALSVQTLTSRTRTTREDQGSIPRATRVGIGTHIRRVVVRSRIGDGPHGKAGDGHGDFDFFRVHVRHGATLSVDTKGSDLDTVVAVYNHAGHIVTANDDASDDTAASAVSYSPARTGDLYVMVSGFSGEAGSLPADPFRSGSGTGAGAQGAYRLRITAAPLDKDLYAVRLRSGDVLGGVLTGGASTVQVRRVDGRGMVGSEQDASAAYPSQSPLPGGGATFAYVAARPGWYAVSVRDGSGRYRLLLETYPPGTASTNEQTIFLDFDGARLNTNIFGGRGVSTLSPLARFLPRWGLRPRDKGPLIAATMRSVRNSISDSLRARGLNRNLAVRILDSRHDPDPFGRPDVSRVVVGGTITESGIPTIGISQSIDPGNFAHEESALALLDELSRRAGPEDSLNTYLRPRSDRVAFVGQALGNVVAHEIGHLLGSFHTDNADARVDLMDAGGSGFGALFGVGRDGVGGTADDADVHFGEDRFSPEEGFTGREDTLNNSAWAFVLRPKP